MPAKEQAAPFLSVAVGRNHKQGKIATTHGLVFARSQAEALGMAINAYRENNRQEDGFSDPVSSGALALSDEVCAEIAKYHASKKGKR